MMIYLACFPTNSNGSNFHQIWCEYTYPQCNQIPYRNWASL